MAKIFFGILAGLLSAVISLVLAYIVGVIAIAVTIRDFVATVLAAVTVLPLMLLFVLLVPTVAVGLLVGLSIGLAAKVTPRDYGVGPTVGLLSATALLSGLLPLIVAPQPGDFTWIVSRPLVAAPHGLVLGFIAARLQRYAPNK